jgi:hypothetical protein
MHIILDEDTYEWQKKEEHLCFMVLWSGDLDAVYTAKHDLRHYCHHFGKESPLYG